MDYIETQILEQPEAGNILSEIGNCYSKKLWHQLTEEVFNFLKLGSTYHNIDFRQFYFAFVKSFEKKLNELRLLEIIGRISSLLPNDQVRYEFLTECIGYDRGIICRTYLNLLLARIHIAFDHKQEALNLYITAKRSIESQPKLKKSPELESKDDSFELAAALSDEGVVLLKSTCYRTGMMYYKRYGPPEDFYHTSTQFLAYSSIDDDSLNLVELAADLSTSALIGRGIYNFGEVLSTPIMYHLINTPYSWLTSLMNAFHNGQVSQFLSILNANKPDFQALVHEYNEEELTTKVLLSSLSCLVFQTPSQERIFSFDVLRARLGINDIEMIIMRGMSEGLIKGSIDQVNETAELTWVVPRVLDAGQVQGLKNQLHDWRLKTTQILTILEAADEKMN